MAAYRSQATSKAIAIVGSIRWHFAMSFTALGFLLIHLARS